MQNAILARNAAALSMMCAADRMYAAVNNPPSFGSSQPLKPALLVSPVCSESAMRTAETKYSVMQHLIKALEKGRNAAIKNSVPKYSGLDYKA